jgi:ABC-type antimicrobial peptide transport system permease subunit
VSRVAAMIVSEAMGICLVALAVGCALGVVAAQIFIGRSQLSGLIRPSFDASTFLWGLAFALGVGLLGALYPTWHAVRLSPSEAFRRE